MRNAKRGHVACLQRWSFVTGKRGGSPAVFAEYDHVQDVLFDEAT